jgi:hypothetical protein
LQEATSKNEVSFEYETNLVKQLIPFRSLSLVIFSLIFFIYSCSKGGGGTTPPSDACAGVTITITGTVVNPSAPGSSDGSISATASGGSGLTFNINGGAFQASGNFTGLGPGSYTISAKNGNGCTGSATFTLTGPNACSGVAGPLFTAVRTVLQNNCVSCHNAAVTEGGMNWTVDCNIVLFKDRIKIRAVDGNPSPMPPTGFLPASEQQKIVNWINAGGRFSD